MYYSSSKGFKTIEMLSNFNGFILPFLGLIHLFINLNKFIVLFNGCCYKLSVLSNARSSLMNSRNIHRLNLLWLLVMTLQTVFYFLIGLAMIDTPGSWVIKRTIPFSSPLPPAVDTIIAYLSYAYESIGMNYITLSLAVYLSFYEFVICFKRIVLVQLHQCNRQSFFHLLNQLEEMINIFESHLSPLPFNWLAYGISPSLCTFLSMAAPDHKAGANSLEVWMIIVHQGLNLIITLIALAFIAYRQERYNKSVDALVRLMQEDISSPLHLSMVERVRQVLSRPTTIWNICAIDRSSILAYIGSAITFSTLFFQLLK